METGLSGPVDWSAPWLQPLRERGERLTRGSPAGLALHVVLNENWDTPVRFVPQSELPVGVPYERYIFESGTCPVRDNLHDLFNGLVWQHFPQSKRRLNELQAREIAGQDSGGARGPVRDAITVLDENGALLAAPPALWQALLARDWRQLFVDLRPLWAQARVLVFGHALLEKLLQPRKEITAHVWRFPSPLGAMAEVDRWLAGQLTAATLAAKPFTPLPVMGIPGWSHENQNFSFYDDSLVFRRPAGNS